MWIVNVIVPILVSWFCVKVLDNDPKKMLIALLVLIGIMLGIMLVMGVLDAVIKYYG